MPNPGTLLYPASGSTRFAARPVSGAVLSSPIDQLSDELVLEQEFMQWRNSFVPLPLNTLYTSESNFVGASDWEDYEDFYLVKESTRQDIGGGFCKWTRTFAKIPPSYSETVSVQYQFIPYYPGVQTITNGIADDGRSSQQGNPSGIAVWDFALVTNPLLIDSVLPPKRAQFYGYAINPPTWTYKPNSQVDQLYPADFPQFNGLVRTYPTLEEYLNWIAVCATVESGGTDPGTGENPQNAGETFPLNFMIRPFDAQRDVWMGKIYYRKTIYINPQ